MRLILSIFLILLTFSGLSQKKLLTINSAGVETILPVGYLHNFHKFGVGANLEFETKRDSSIFGHSFTTGYYCIVGDSAFKTNTKILFPLLLGLRYHFVNTGITIGQSAGVSYFTEGIGLKFTYSPMIRLEYDKMYVDLKYTTSLNAGHANDFSFVGLRMAYKL